MKLVILLLIVVTSGCAPTYKLVRVEKVGPTEVETWRDNRTGLCEKRVYLDSMYFRTEVPCHA